MRRSRRKVKRNRRGAARRRAHRRRRCCRPPRQRLRRPKTSVQERRKALGLRHRRLLIPLARISSRTSSSRVRMRVIWLHRETETLRIQLLLRMPYRILGRQRPGSSSNSKSQQTLSQVRSHSMFLYFHSALLPFRFMFHVHFIWLAGERMRGTRSQELGLLRVCVIA